MESSFEYEQNKFENTFFSSLRPDVRATYISQGLELEPLVKPTDTTNFQSLTLQSFVNEKKQSLV
jgi:hypothetical protein